MGATLTRIYHPWWKWECYLAGFYGTVAPWGLSPDDAREFYRVFLADLDWFDTAITTVFMDWPHSCEQFLTNPSINRIAWLGQASMCAHTGVPSAFRGGFKLLTVDQRRAANALAEKRIAEWMLKR